MKQKATILTLLFAVAFLTTTVWGQSLFKEDFNYTTGDSLTNHAWLVSSGGTTNALLSTSPGLTFTNYASSGVGNCTKLDTTGQDLYKSYLKDSIGSVYLTFMLNVTKATSTGDYFIALSPSAAQTNYYARTFIKSSGAGFVVGISKSNETAVYSTTVFSLNTTYLAVVKYKFVAADSDFINVYILPDGTSLGSEPTTPELAYHDITKNDAVNLGFVTLRQGAAANAPRLFVDGVRIGTTWNDVFFSALLSRSSINFGTLNLGSIATDSFYIKNTGSSSVNIDPITSTDPVFSVSPTTASIATADSQKVLVTYTPTQTVVSTAKISITPTGSTTIDSVTVTGAAVQAGFSVAPHTISFGNVFKDSTKTDSAIVTNASNTAHLVIDSIVSTNPSFVVTPTSGNLDTVSTMKFTIDFKPTAKGAASGNIVFYHNAPSHHDTVKLSGNGILKEPLFSVIPTALNFHGVLIGQSKIDSVTVKNVGYDSLIISNVTSTDGVFTLTPTTARLDTGKSEKFYFTFTPTALGIKSASIVFANNASEVDDTLKIVGSGTNTVTIAEARKDDNGDLVPDHSITKDTLVIIGIIITPNMGASASQTSYFIQDSTGGIDVFAYGLSSTVYAIGDSVMVTGTVAQYKGLDELTLLALDDTHFKILKHNAVVPKPKRLTLHQFVTNAESYEGQLIEIDTLYKATGTWPASPSNVSIYVTNGSQADTAQVFLDLDSGIGGTEPVFPINIVGYVSQYSTATPPNNGYEIAPRDSNDITKTEIQIITVDGFKDDFYGTLTGPADGYLQIRSYAWNDNGKPTNDNDLSAKVWTAWDPTWFYLYAEVKDDTVCGNAPNVYQEDGMELKFDPQATSTANSIYAVGITALGKGSPGVVKADSLGNVPDSMKQWARRIIPGGYALEIAMKWSVIGATEKISVAKDSVFGLAVCFHDNDSSKTRVASIEWAAMMKDSVWNTPKYLGTVKFLADNKLDFIAKNNITGLTNPIPYDGSDYIRTGVDKEQIVPKEFSLAQNYPNPFNPSTTIEYTLPLRSTVTIKIYSILGQEIATLVNSEQGAGYYRTVWNASGVASGMYLARITAQAHENNKSFVQVKKLLLMK